MGRRPVLVGVAVWLAVVTVVSVATWTVIDAAGRDVTARPASDPAAARDLGSTTSSPATTPSSPSATRSPRPQRTRSPRATTTPPSVTAAPSTAPPSPAATAVAPSRTPDPAPPPAPIARERTWTGAAGTVTSRCVGSRISLVSATPSNGWRMEVDDRGPGRVRVEFKNSGEGEDVEDVEDVEDRETEVRAECVGGAPRYRVGT
jgi:hypothetical protein